MPFAPNEYLEPALDSQADSLTYLAACAFAAQDPAACYAPSLIKALAAAPAKDQRDLMAELKEVYGRDLNLTRLKSELKENKIHVVPAGREALILSEKGNPRPVLANAITELRASSLSLQFDQFVSQVVHKTPSGWGTQGPWTDLDDIRAAEWLQHKGVLVESRTAHSAAITLAHEHPFHPVRDYLEHLEWDQESRLTHWLVDCVGTKNDDYHQQISKLWLISAVARILHPGCKADQMLVLEGPEGALKSSVLRALANGHMDTSRGCQWFKDNTPDIDHKDIGQHMQGVWIIEFSELDAIQKVEWTRTKKFISLQSDCFRSPYGYNTQDYPRQCIFAGSTNADQWLTDPTGSGRRFWPVRVGKINIARTIKHRDQIWAEAVFRCKQGEQWYGDATLDVLAREQQAERQEQDIWTEKIADWVENPHVRPASSNGYHSSRNEIYIDDILDHALGVTTATQRGPEVRRVQRVMRQLGYKRERENAGARDSFYTKG